MATDLFSKYYNNPTKSYIYTDILCNNGDSADELSFDINDSAGEITDNNDILSSLDLSDIHVGLSQYASNSRILQPNEFCYIRGWVFGDSYCSKSYGKIIGPITDDEDWMYKGIMFFVINYINTNTEKKVTESIKCTGRIEDRITFIDVINNHFTENEIPITVTFDNGCVVFTATKTDYEFWVNHIMFWYTEEGTDVLHLIDQWMIENNHTYDYGWDDRDVNNDTGDDINIYSAVIKRGECKRLYNLLNCLNNSFTHIIDENNVKIIYLLEEFEKYIPSKRYKNGAMLGIILNIIYPQYETEDIEPMHKSVKIAHIVDRVQDFYAVPKYLSDDKYIAIRKIIDVNDLFQCECNTKTFKEGFNYEYIEQEEICHDSSIYCDECGCLFNYINQMGVEGYCNYMSKTKGWINVGQFYARTTIPDDPNYPEIKNLIPSVIVYNPNDFPVQIKYLTFA